MGTYQLFQAKSQISCCFLFLTANRGRIKCVAVVFLTEFCLYIML